MNYSIKFLIASTVRNQPNLFTPSFIHAIMISSHEVCHTGRHHHSTQHLATTPLTTLTPLISPHNHHHSTHPPIIPSPLHPPNSSCYHPSTIFIIFYPLYPCHETINKIFSLVCILISFEAYVHFVSKLFLFFFLLHFLNRKFLFNSQKSLFVYYYTCLLIIILIIPFFYYYFFFYFSCYKLYCYSCL